LECETVTTDPQEKLFTSSTNPVKVRLSAIVGYLSVDVCRIYAIEIATTTLSWQNYVTKFIERCRHVGCKSSVPRQTLELALGYGGGPSGTTRLAEHY
jgi:hypothetical protein